MNVNRIVHVRNDSALKTLQEFLAAWWARIELDAMLAPVQSPERIGVVPTVVSHPADLSSVNPFAPVMLSNSAHVIQNFLEDHPHSHLAVLVRPCELRALIELRKRNRIWYHSIASGNFDENLVLISVDCPGTFSADTYARHAVAHNGDGDMLHVELSYGRRESYIPYDVRPACQMCDSPAPLGADVTIGTIGIEPQGHLLVIARNEEIDASLRLADVTDGLATECQVVCREMMVGKLVDKRAEKRADLTREEISQAENIHTALAMLARCTLCADCLDACPLYDGELAGMLGVGEGRQSGRSLLFELVRLSRWLASCSGCGMCQASCPNGVALSRAITTLSHSIQAELHYRAGDPTQRLPWTAG